MTTATRTRSTSPRFEREERTYSYPCRCLQGPREFRRGECQRCGREIAGPAREEARLEAIQAANLADLSVAIERKRWEMRMEGYFDTPDFKQRAALARALMADGMTAEEAAWAVQPDL